MSMKRKKYSKKHFVRFTLNKTFDIIYLYEQGRCWDIMKNMVFVNCRELKGFSQVELADKLGICKDYVNMIENNRRKPGLALAKKIADLFGTTVDNLFF